eukprot:2909383-Karenia_brevis.AAC.1
MRCQQQHWPHPDNNPTVGIESISQSVPEVDTTTANLVWKGEPVTTSCPPPPPPWRPAVEMGTP